MQQFNLKSRAYQTAVSVCGVAAWACAALYVAASYAPRDRLIVLALAPLVIFVGSFTTTFRMPSGFRFTAEKATFSLSDALHLLVALDAGAAAAIVLAGVESAYTMTWRERNKPSTAWFSIGMMILSVGAATAAMRLLTAGANPVEHSLVRIAAAFVASSFVHTAVNISIYSLLLALRHGRGFPHYVRSFAAVSSLFLISGSAATVLHLALQYSAGAVVLLGAPVIAALYHFQRQLRDSVQKRITGMEKSHRETIEALAVTINAKDEVTHEHVLRVQVYAMGVARLMGCAPSEIEALEAGALLHDVGKIAVPDYILNKPGKLTKEEFDKMKSHTVVGAKILGRVEFPYPVVPIVRSHHERWDGKGYPDGLTGEQIPLTARILSVVDCFDAVREDRPYRRGMTRDEAVALIRDGSGTQYDPRVVETFLNHLAEFEAEVSRRAQSPAPTFGIEPVEELSAAAKEVAPAAGFVEQAAYSATASTPRHDEHAALSELSDRLALAAPEALAETFTILLEQLVPFDLCAVVLPTPGGYGVAAARGACARHLLCRRVRLGEGVTGWVLANRRPFLNANPALDLPPGIGADGARLRTVAVFPVCDEVEFHGAVALYSGALAAYNDYYGYLIGEACSRLAGMLTHINRRRRASEAAAPELASSLSQ